MRLEPGEGTITRRNGERVNTLQAFLLRGVLPEEALASVQAEMAAQGFALPRATGSISAGTAMRGPRRSTTCWRRWA
jgi:hypothetical protein